MTLFRGIDNDHHNTLLVLDLTSVLQVTRRLTVNVFDRPA
jgi:hypothetical protein